VGRRIADALAARRIPIVIAEQNRELVEELRKRHVPAVSGDASDPAVLIQAHIARARVLVVAIPDAAGVRKMVETAKTLNPRVEILLRTHNDEEGALLRRENLGLVFMGEHELAQAMTREVLGRLEVKTDSGSPVYPVVSSEV
jgi:CPA2 family monovalent cation:H+ antiporter-2